MTCEAENAKRLLIVYMSDLQQHLAQQDGRTMHRLMAVQAKLFHHGLLVLTG